ncbi:MAG: hypothetical protein EOP54_19000 [Sphingobacteriales bacterium]|nr:MAG: hypothetical protein EOP54_19000 [Sphingobacteriales bacterium]
MDNTLHELITNKAFENQQHGLQARFSANHIDYAYKYNEGSTPSITIWLNHGNIPASITIAENGLMGFTYFDNGRNYTQQFKNCTEADFNLMIAHAFIYLRDSNFEKHKDWYAGLEKA